MANNCWFTSDLHGHANRYQALFAQIRTGRPRVVLLGGDLLPNSFANSHWDDFVADFLRPGLDSLRQDLQGDYPALLLILGNDDPAALEPDFLQLESDGLCRYMHKRHLSVDGRLVYGYACIPPSPFLLKDWERYDVSRFVDPGCVPPDEGQRTVEPADDIRFSTIQDDLQALTGDTDLSQAVILFHCPPYGGLLDRAALDGQQVDHVPLDVHVGSIAIQRFLEQRAPRVSLHGHVHESARLTGQWRQVVGKTHAFSGAHDGPELALVRFDPDHPGMAQRELLP